MSNANEQFYPDEPEVESEMRHTVMLQAPEAEAPLDELFCALAKAHLEIKNAEKDMDNDFLNSRYASLAACLNAVREPLAKNGLAIIQMPVPSGSPSEQRLETMLVHSSGQYISSTIVMTPPKTDPQGVGSAMTYMRRYALSAMCGISQVDDDAEATKKPKDEYDRITPKEADAILNLADELFADKSDEVVGRMLEKVFSTSDVIIDRVTDIPAGQAEAAMNLLKNKHKRDNKPKPKAK